MTDEEITDMVDQAWELAPDCRAFLLLDDGDQISVHRSTLADVNECMQEDDSLQDHGPFSVVWILVDTKTMKYVSGHVHRLSPGGDA